MDFRTAVFNTIKDSQNGNVYESEFDEEQICNDSLEQKTIIYFETVKKDLLNSINQKNYKNKKIKIQHYNDLKTINVDETLLRTLCEENCISLNIRTIQGYKEYSYILNIEKLRLKGVVGKAKQKIK